MPLKIDISDSAIEKDESVHQLHIWGAHTSLFKTNCVVCGEDTDASKIRCACGEGFFCSPECRDHPTAQPETQCLSLNAVPLKARPSRNHRRALVLHSGTPNISLVWAEIKGSKLIIDHPSLDGFFEPLEEAGEVWLDLAVINPAVNSVLFKKIGHGIAMGFASNTLQVNSAAPNSHRNKGVQYITTPGRRVLWPGPVVFFCYGYDLSDYVKVNQAQFGKIEHGAEAGMSKREIWDELNKLRWDEDSKSPPSKDPGPAGPGWKVYGRVWRWKVKERGTSMKILDLVHRDLNTILDYFACTRLNPIPARPQGCTSEVRAMHVRDPNHPGYTLNELWDHDNPISQSIYKNMMSTSTLTPNGQHQTKPHDLSFKSLTLPHCPAQAFPIIGAFAVGLRIMVHFSMDINPPFRANLPLPARHGALTSLMWAADPVDSPAAAAAFCLGLFCPSQMCDSLILVHGRFGPLVEDHLRALVKYLDFTEPRQWTRRGPRGFEAYWRTYAKIDLPRERAGLQSPYELEDKVQEATRMAHAVMGGEDLVERMMAHLTLEGLGPDEERREEIAERRAGMLKTIAGYRKSGNRFAIGSGM